MTPVLLEITGSRNYYVLSFHALSLKVTKLQVKADFEKLAQGGRLLSLNGEEVSEIEWEPLSGSQRGRGLPQ